VGNLKVPNPPLARNCEREDSVRDGHWETGKADGRTPFNGAPLSQETLVYAPPRMGLVIFS